MIESLNHLTQAEYRQHPAVSQSDLKKCYENPQLFHQVKTGRVAPDPPSKSQVWGTQCEHYIRTGRIDAVLIPRELLRKDGGRNGSSQEYKEFCHEQRGRTLLTRAEWEGLAEQFKHCVYNIENHARANELIYCPSAEWSQRWLYQCPFTGLQMKCEMDLLDFVEWNVVDLKTADDVTERAVFSDIIKYGYDIQAASYVVAAELLGGGEWTWSWVFVRNKPPYNVEVYEASREILEFGHKRLLERIALYRQCVDSGKWVTPTHGGAITVYPPKWASNMESYV